MSPLTDTEFARFQRFIFERAGISLSGAKHALVSGRLGKRLAHHGLDSFSAYFQLLASGRDAAEEQIAVDLLTTNETWFFREPRHFEVLRECALAPRPPGTVFRAWSAAGSTGEEAYSMAMVLAQCLPAAGWEVLATDISSQVLQHAVRGLYAQERARHMPAEMLHRWCLKGTGDYAGKLLVAPELRRAVRFGQLNLDAPLPEIGRFDIVFLRNVMIYFNDDTKRGVLARVAGTLRPGGCLCIGHSESLHGLGTALEMVAPSVFRRPA